MCWRARKAVPGGCLTDSPVPALFLGAGICHRGGYKAGFAEASGAVEKDRAGKASGGIFQADPGRVGGTGADRVSPGFPGVFAGGGPAPECLELAAGGKKLRLAGVFSGCTPDETARALERLRYDGKTIRTVTTLERYRQVPLETDRRQARKLVFLLGMETAEELLRFREEPELLKWLEVIRGQGLCCSLSQLSVNGED